MYCDELLCDKISPCPLHEESKSPHKSWKSLGRFDVALTPSSAQTEKKEASEKPSLCIPGIAYFCDDPVPSNNYFKHAQDHLPLAYGLIRDFVTPQEVKDLELFFRQGGHPAVKKTLFQGDDIDHGEGGGGEPEVFQLYANGEPFKTAFPGLYQRVLNLKTSFGLKIGVGAEELADVTFCQDIRHIKYHPGDDCMWHRDDPENHFTTILMCSQQGKDYEGGQLTFHPTDAPHPIKLNFGDAVIYCTPKVEHMVTKTTKGARTIFLVELKAQRLANLKEE